MSQTIGLELGTMMNHGQTEAVMFQFISGSLPSQVAPKYSMFFEDI